MSEFMITGQSDLFHVTLHRQQYLRGVGVQSIIFSKPRCANVTLVACTPDAIMTLMYAMPDGITLEIVNRDRGLRAEYTAEDVIVRMKHCIFHERWFHDLVPINASDSEQMTLYTKMTCELEVLLDR